jgi:hypothetical protein
LADVGSLMKGTRKGSIMNFNLDEFMQATTYWKISKYFRKRKSSVLNFNFGEFRAGFDLGISSRGGCFWSTDIDYRKMVSILAHCVNSVSGLSLDFAYGLAFDFWSHATCKLTAAMCFAVQIRKLIAAAWCPPYFLLLYSLYCISKFFWDIQECSLIMCTVSSCSVYKCTL